MLSTPRIHKCSHFIYLDWNEGKKISELTSLALVRCASRVRTMLKVCLTALWQFITRTHLLLGYSLHTTGTEAVPGFCQDEPCTRPRGVCPRLSG